jgi:teichuronic acid exporter
MRKALLFWPTCFKDSSVLIIFPMAQSASKSSIQVLFGSFSGKLLNLISLVLVTPILGPEGFGSLVVVGIILSVFNTIIDIGFEHYYIIKVKLSGPDKTSDDEVKLIEDIVFNLRFYSNLILFILQIAISFLGKDVLFSSPIDSYLRILSLNYLLNMFGRINEVRLKKRMEFKSITLSKIMGDFIGSITKVVLVYAGFGIIGWAYGLIVSTAIATVVLMMSSNYKPNFIKIPAAWKKEVYWFAKYSWLSGLGLYFSNQVSNIILKSFFSLSQMGYVQFSNSYTVEIQSGLLSSQMQVLIPYYSNFQHDPGRIRRGINQYVEAAFFVLGLPFSFGIFFCRELILLIFGPQWLPAYPIVVMYCVYGLFRIIFSPLLSILSSLGKIEQTTKLSFFNFAFLGIALVLVAVFTEDIYWYAFVFVTASLITDCIKGCWGLHYLQISIWEIIEDCRNSILCIIITILILWGFHYFLPVTSLVKIALIFSLAAIVFFASHFLINRKVFNMFLEKIRHFRIK